MVLTDDSFAVPSPCPFCPALISSKSSAHYLLLLCPFCLWSHWTITRIVSCQHQKKPFSLSFSPSLILDCFRIIVTWNLPSLLLLASSLAALFLLSPLACLSHSKAIENIPGSIASCVCPFIASSQFVFPRDRPLAESFWGQIISTVVSSLLLFGLVAGLHMEHSIYDNGSINTEMMRVSQQQQQQQQ